MKERILSTFTAEKGSWSSKRTMGIFQIVIVSLMYIYCGLTGKDMPSDTALILGSGTTLIGLTAFGNNSKTDKKDPEEDE